MSQIPMEWKLANIIPIHKQGNFEQYCTFMSSFSER